MRSSQEPGRHDPELERGGRADVRLFLWRSDRAPHLHARAAGPSLRSARPSSKESSGGERVDHFETVRVRKDGRRIDVSVTISPIKDATGKVIGSLRDQARHHRAEASQRRNPGHDPAALAGGQAGQRGRAGGQHRPRAEQPPGHGEPAHRIRSGTDARGRPEPPGPGDHRAGDQADGRPGGQPAAVLPPRRRTESRRWTSARN